MSKSPAQTAQEVTRILQQRLEDFFSGGRESSLEVGVRVARFVSILNGEADFPEDKRGKAMPLTARDIQRIQEKGFSLAGLASIGVASNTEMVGGKFENAQINVEKLLDLRKEFKAGGREKSVAQEDVAVVEPAA